ncbi:hypothetical protein ACRQ5Q_39415 [Bradyrhizobium sp. PMVTL-01]|uniref:hypothetical protein n=1 Tax=Bradyrhizobium sp. PMVTL-01 TaxID=3434999 RepID=UPI003F72FA7D
MKYAILALGLLVTPVAAKDVKYTADECEVLTSYFDQCTTEDPDDPNAGPMLEVDGINCLPEMKWKMMRPWMYKIRERHHMAGTTVDKQDEFSEICMQVCDKKLTKEEALHKYCGRRVEQGPRTDKRVNDWYEGLIKKQEERRRPKP